MHSEHNGQFVETEQKNADEADFDDFVPLPDMNDDGEDDKYYGGDPTLWQGDDYDTQSCASNEDIHENTDPFYANQEEDPEVQRIQFEFNQYIEGVFK